MTIYNEVEDKINSILNALPCNFGEDRGVFIGFKNQIIEIFFDVTDVEGFTRPDKLHCLLDFSRLLVNNSDYDLEFGYGASTLVQNADGGMDETHSQFATEKLDQNRKIVRFCVGTSDSETLDNLDKLVVFMDKNARKMFPSEINAVEDVMVDNDKEKAPPVFGIQQDKIFLAHYVTYVIQQSLTGSDPKIILPEYSKGFEFKSANLPGDYNRPFLVAQYSWDYDTTQFVDFYWKIGRIINSQSLNVFGFTDENTGEKYNIAMYRNPARIVNDIKANDPETFRLIAMQMDIEGPDADGRFAPQP